MLSWSEGAVRLSGKHMELGAPSALVSEAWRQEVEATGHGACAVRRQSIDAAVLQRFFLTLHPKDLVREIAPPEFRAALPLQ